MQINTTKAKLKAGEAVFGCFVRTTDASMVEFLSYLGWDFIVFDGEHGTLEPHHVENLVRAAELRGVTPMARVSANQPQLILRMLDVGAHGLHVPWVNSGAEAEAVILAAKYQPRGLRGLASVRAAGFGQSGQAMSDYVAHANRETLTVVHIETAEAVTAIDDILATPDLDVVFVGRTDLSQSLGHPGNMAHPDVLAAVERVARAAAGSPVALGMIVPDADDAQAWRERGARYIATTMESVVAPACRAYLATARGKG